MNRRELLGGGFFLAIGVIFVLYSLQLPLGSMRLPGPGFVPLGAGVCLVLFSGAILVREFVRREGGVNGSVPLSRLRPIVEAAVSIAAYSLLLPVLGFVPATILLLIHLFSLGAGHALSMGVVAAAVVSAVAAFLLFGIVLELDLPAGSIWGQ